MTHEAKKALAGQLPSVGRSMCVEISLKTSEVNVPVKEHDAVFSSYEVRDDDSSCPLKHAGEETDMMWEFCSDLFDGVNLNKDNKI